MEKYILTQDQLNQFERNFFHYDYPSNKRESQTDVEDGVICLDYMCYYDDNDNLIITIDDAYFSHDNTEEYDIKDQLEELSYLINMNNY